MTRPNNSVDQSQPVTERMAMLEAVVWQTAKIYHIYKTGTDSKEDGTGPTWTHRRPLDRQQGVTEQKKIEKKEKHI